jgi:hypothetical protein
MAIKRVAPDEETGRPAVDEEEYEYKKVVWKDFFRKPKYIRSSRPISDWENGKLTGAALWIIGIIAIVLSILITINHNKVVTVSSQLPDPR